MNHFLILLILRSFIYPLYLIYLNSFLILIQLVIIIIFKPFYEFLVYFI